MRTFTGHPNRNKRNVSHSSRNRSNVSRTMTVSSVPSSSICRRRRRNGVVVARRSTNRQWWDRRPVAADNRNGTATGRPVHRCHRLAAIGAHLLVLRRVGRRTATTVAIGGLRPQCRRHGWPRDFRLGPHPSNDSNAYFHRSRIGYSGHRWLQNTRVPVTL